MSKFQKLSQLNKDIELLENAGNIRAAEIMHKKFIKEAQYMMPQMMIPQMMMPQMMPMIMPQMMARPAAPATTTVPNRPVAPAVTTTPSTIARPAAPQTSAQGQVSTNQAGQAGQAGQGYPGTVITGPGKPTGTPTTGGQMQPPYEGSYTDPGGRNVAPPSQTGYGNQQGKDNELQYLENELQRLQKEHGMDCGPFAAQCNTLKQMIDKNKGGSVIKG